MLPTVVRTVVFLPSTVMIDKRKLALVLRAGAKDYAVIMAMTSTMTVASKSRKPTAAEYITEMHK